MIAVQIGFNKFCDFSLLDMLWFNNYRIVIRSSMAPIDPHLATIAYQLQRCFPFLKNDNTFLTFLFIQMFNQPTALQINRLFH